MLQRKKHLFSMKLRHVDAEGVNRKSKWWKLFSGLSLPFCSTESYGEICIEKRLNENPHGYPGRDEIQISDGCWLKSVESELAVACYQRHCN